MYDAQTEAKVVDLGQGEAAVQAVCFSPRSSFLQVFHKPSGADGDKNLRLYALPCATLALSLAHKTFTRDRWPVLQWSEDEAVLMRCVTNEVHLYTQTDFHSAQPSRRLRVPGITAASISPGPVPWIGAFVPEAKGAPASLRIYALPPVQADSAVSEPQPVSRRSFFRATFVRFRWNAQGSAVLVLAFADVDATNQSYYGESSLHFLRCDGAVEGAVALPKEGPVHDVAWSPKGTEFVAVYGFMPARATLFSDKLKVLFEVPAGPYNTARWNPFGRFLALAGFGNLPGDVALLDRKADGKCKPMAETRLANSVSLEWSPCGRYLLTATTAPRLQVDNGFRVTKYTGERLFERPSAPSQLYACEWQPCSAQAQLAYPDRPQTPGAATAAKSAPSVLAAAKAAPYRPPGAARAGPPASGAPQFSLARDVQPFLKPGTAERLAQAKAVGPPGAEFVEPELSKSAKKRLAQQKRDAAAATSGVGNLALK